MASTVTVALASQTLTLSGQPLDTETVVIGSKTYTFQTTLTDSDGNVKIGADAEASLQNLFDAINLSGTAGTQYAASMTRHPQVVAYSNSATTLVVKAPGAAANAIATTETLTNGSWGAATMAGGSGNLSVFITDVLNLNQVNAEVQRELKRLTVADD